MASFANLDAITAALKQRNFAWYFAGSSIGLIGIWGQRLTISWLAWEFTRSGFWLGVVVAADLLPTIFFAPIAGVVADRVNRHRMMFVTQFLGMLQALTLAALAFSGLLDIWWLVGLTLFIGIVWAFNTAARLSMVPNLLEPQHVPSAVAMDSAIFNLARFIGPMVAGYLIAGVGAGPTFLINGWGGQVVIPVRIMRRTPAASAMRKADPTLIGSCMSCSTKTMSRRLGASIVRRN